MEERSWQAPNFSYRHGFNGMEQDNEVKGDGNSLDFGARIYDSRLGRWMSTDPLQSKYAGMSPYNFVGNNPIIYIDKDGRDYELYIDHENKTVIVKATFTTFKEDGTQVHPQQIADFYNQLNGQYSYAVKEGSKKVLYDLQFEINTVVMKGGVPTTESTSVDNIVVPVSKKSLIKGSGIKDAQGMSEGPLVYMEDTEVGTKRGEEIVIHEGGHSLGFRHTNFGVMTPDGGGDQDVSIENLYDILGGAGYGKKADLKNESWSGGKPTKIEESGESPSNFNSGKFVSSKKAKRIEKRMERKTK